MSIRNLISGALLCLFFSQIATAQFPTATEEHKLLKQDVGTWTATVKTWMGPDGQPAPDAEPMVTKGEEVNRMLGQFWVVSSFKGEFGGMPFEGLGTSGYDTKTKKFVGSWVDSFSPSAMQMVGTYDKATKTLTHMTTGVGMDGQEYKGKSELVYKDENTRLLTMYEMKDGKALRSMEILYERKK